MITIDNKLGGKYFEAHTKWTNIIQETSLEPSLCNSSLTVMNKKRWLSVDRVRFSLAPLEGLGEIWGFQVAFEETALRVFILLPCSLFPSGNTGIKDQCLGHSLSSQHKMLSALLSCHLISTNSLTLHPGGIACTPAFKMCEPNFICNDFSFYPLICHHFFTMSKA